MTDWPNIEDAGKLIRVVYGDGTVVIGILVFQGTWHTIEGQPNNVFAVEYPVSPTARKRAPFEDHKEWNFTHPGAPMGRWGTTQERENKMNDKCKPKFDIPDFLRNPGNLAEEKRIKALELIEEYGGIDGAHHKQWLLDQLVQLLSNDYWAWLKKWQAGEEGPKTYTWDTGIAP